MKGSEEKGLNDKMCLVNHTSARDEALPKERRKDF